MSDTNGKVKIYKNPDRAKAVQYKPYVPQYEVHGKEPEEYQGATVPSDTKIARPNADNPRLKRQTISQPYASPTTSPIGRGKGPIPNVGNNMENTWSSVDGHIVDDLSNESIDPDQTMIDNNDFVTDEALGFRSGIMAEELQPNSNQGKVTIEGEFNPARNNELDSYPEQYPPDSMGDVLSILQDLSDDTYLLIVTGVPICSGPKEEIQEQASALVFGEHELCDGNPIPVDDIVIIKRVQVKVGLFLE